MVQVALAADFALIVVAATAIGLVARQLGQPTIVAYIITGVVLGPVVLDVVTVEVLVIALATVFGATPIIVNVLTDKDEITERADANVALIRSAYGTRPTLRQGIAERLSSS